MSETSDTQGGVSRRDLLRTAAAGLAAAGALSAQTAQHVHEAVAEEKKTSGAYKPKCFTEHEYKTLEKLCDLIVPADGRSKGALAAGAPEFIDLLSSQNAELAAIYTGGLAWLDAAMERRYSAKFINAKPEQQTAMLDLIAYRKNDSAELGPGIRFFDWARRMTVDAFYTSKVGIEDLGYMGNAALAVFQVPEQSLEYALKRSGLG